jgi:hypothetical protein
VSSGSAHADGAAGRTRPAPNLHAIDAAVERAQKRNDT